MNLEASDREVSRRLIDFASGLCYGLNGTMEKVATGVYLLSRYRRARAGTTAATSTAECPLRRARQCLTSEHGLQPADRSQCRFQDSQEGLRPGRGRRLQREGRGGDRDRPEPGDGDGSPGPRRCRQAARGVAAGHQRQPAQAASPSTNDEDAETISRTLLLAQRTADTTVAQANADAESITVKARVDATTVIDNARSMADKLLDEARVEARRRPRPSASRPRTRCRRCSPAATSCCPTSIISSTTSARSASAFATRPCRCKISSSVCPAASARCAARCCRRHADHCCRVHHRQRLHPSPRRRAARTTDDVDDCRRRDSGLRHVAGRADLNPTNVRVPLDSWTRLPLRRPAPIPKARRRDAAMRARSRLARCRRGDAAQLVAGRRRSADHRRRRTAVIHGLSIGPTGSIAGDVDEAITSEPSEEQPGHPALSRTERVQPVIAGATEWLPSAGGSKQGGIASTTARPCAT